MTFDKQSNVRRTAVESKSNRSCNHGARYGKQNVLRPAASARETTVAVCDDTKPRMKFEPQHIGTPATWMLSLTTRVLPAILSPLVLLSTISVIHALYVQHTLHGHPSLHLPLLSASHAVTSPYSRRASPPIIGWCR